MKFFYKCYFLFLFAFFIASCEAPQEKKLDTPTSGTITLSADESFYPIVQAEIEAFQNLYSNTSINAKYQSEDESVMALLNDQVDIIMISRELNEAEKEFIKNKKITVNVRQVATDAVTVIVNKNYPDSIITVDQLKKIFKGELTKWNELIATMSAEPIRIIVDKSTSSNISFLKQQMELNPVGVNIYAAGSNKEVLKYIKNNPYGIGIIGVNWISDEDDPELNSKLENIKVLSVGKEDSTSGFYQPLQTHLTEGGYPLQRSLYIVNKNTRVGLGTGFASYVLSDPGQRIVLKSGLLPANMPGREIQINRNSL